MPATTTALNMKEGTKLYTFCARAEAASKYPAIDCHLAEPELWGLKPNPNCLGYGPNVDISGFRVSGHFDTLKLAFRLKKIVSINTFRHAVWNSPTLTPDNRVGKRKTRNSVRFNKHMFRITLHDVTVEKLVTLMSIFEKFGGLAHDAMVLEAHFALDWRSASREDRERMASVMPMVINVAGLDLTGSGTPRQYAPDDALTRPGTLHLRTSKPHAKEGKSIEDLRPKFYDYNPIYTCPGTFYFGARKGTTDMLRIYHKVENAGQELEENEQVVRHERVFRGESLKKLGIDTLSGLIGFDARKLARSFSYEIAAVPAEKGMLQLIRLFRIEKLMKAGAFAVRESEGGASRWRPRGRKATLALLPMNKRSSNAWDAFARKWQAGATRCLA